MTPEHLESVQRTGFRYVGQELPLFEHAQNWKHYFRSQLKAFITGTVAEIGAGNGGTTAVLSELPHNHWYAIEPDPGLASDLVRRRRAGELAPTVEPLLGGLEVLTSTAWIDTILYIDVLEHIAEDRTELKMAAAHLRTGGHVIVLSPAYQALFSPFDAAIGHCRRYTARSLREITPASLRVQKTFYLDSIGLLTSVANKLFLRQSVPSRGQILFWDRVLLPLSLVVDRVTCRTFGRSVVMVWQKC